MGGGGREHALVWKMARSRGVEVLCAPGNHGMEEAHLVDLAPEDIAGLLAFAKSNAVDLTVVGPEAPLVRGIVDAFEEEGLAIFGPTRAAAMLEGSKAFAKEVMLAAGVPTARARTFTDPEAALRYVRQVGPPLVVKADGLAAGKGVSVCFTEDDAARFLREVMVERKFGDAGERVVIEEYLEGEEVSVLAFTDGREVIPLIASQDHKRAFDGDEGPNTGGMGAYAPVPAYGPAVADVVREEILDRVVRAMAERGIPYRGVLYAGLMLTAAGPRVLEFNVRFGDPEAQAILPLLETDLVEVLMAAVRGELRGARLDWRPESCVCVVLASGGYPGPYRTGMPIEGLDSASTMEGVEIFHAGTRRQGGAFLTDGGRVLGVTARGPDLARAVELAYRAVARISFPGMHYRTDIARRGLLGR